MATETYKFTGKSKWAKVYDPEEFRGASNWKINVYLDDAEIAKRKKAGIQSKTYSDEDGTYVTFKRPQTKLIKGVLNEFAPPKIYDAEGNCVVDYKKSADGTNFERVGKPVLIGNGSVVEATVTVYDTQMGKGQRLESIKIIDLIEYEGGSGFSDSIVKTGTSPTTPSITPWS